ncbi:hypothetical protein F6X42_42160 [Paraburkholderia sp. WC7.3b]|uniref:Uncharacterized protein n=1 Tax=Paraburkholderia podalyriae TaxID=1938811 RepID=A0ABR7Q2E2_9BURK|nr:hypothetical protein [Paraburkholderia podalyriae]
MLRSEIRWCPPEMHRDVRSIERVAHQLQAGIVGINEGAPASEAGSPESLGDYQTRADCSRIA